MSAAIKTCTGNSIAKLAWDYENNKQSFGAKDQNAINILNSFLAGTGFGQVSLKYMDDRSVGAGTTNDDLDLTGVLVDIYGAVLAFTKVKALLIYNKSLTDGDNLLVGGAGVVGNAWAAPFNGSQVAQVVVQANSPWLLVAMSGLPVVAGTGDILRISYAGISGHIGYQIALLG